MKADKGRSDYPYLFARLFLSHFSFVPHSTQELLINLNKSIQGPTRWLRGWSSWGQAMRTRFVHNGEDTALENQVLACQRIWRRHQENITSSLLGYIARGKENRNKLKQRRFQLLHRTTFLQWGLSHSGKACPQMLSTLHPYRLPVITKPLSSLAWIQCLQCYGQEVYLEISCGPCILHNSEIQILLHEGKRQNLFREKTPVTWLSTIKMVKTPLRLGRIYNLSWKQHHLLHLLQNILLLALHFLQWKQQEYCNSSLQGKQSFQPRLRTDCW